MLIGIANDTDRFQVAKQRAYLIAHGVDPKRVYELGIEGETLSEIIAAAARACRAGDLLAMAKGARALGDSLAAISAGMNLIEAEGVAMIDPAEPAWRSDTADIRKMVERALGILHGEPRIGDRATAMAVESAKVRRAKRDRRRLVKAEADTIWHRDDLSIRQKLALMRGWSRAVAFEELGRTGVPPGPKTILE